MQCHGLFCIEKKPFTHVLFLLHYAFFWEEILQSFMRNHAVSVVHST
jgi:hypothetical protein